jgi:molybdopterin biosynthesis enzyme MoaB
MRVLFVGGTGIISADRIIEAHEAGLRLAGRPV